MTLIRWMRVRFGLSAAIVLVVGASTSASFATAQPTSRLARVEGMAYDSLAKRPLRDAFISVVGTSRSTTSDEKGRFRLDSVPEGQQQFTMQHAAFDSLGLSGVSARVMVQQKTPRVILAVPSFETLWRAACGEVPAPRDSALVYGTVRDAVGGLAQSGALVDVSWIDLVGGGNSLASIGQRRWHRHTTTDEHGEFAVCGVPAQTPLTLRAALDSTDTLTVSTMALGATTVRVRRRDVLIARTIAAAPTIETSGAARDDRPAVKLRSVPSGVVTGVVTNAAGTPIANAAVAIDTLTEVRSNDDGQFLVSRVPAGSRQVSVVAIGMKPYTIVIEMPAGDTVRLIVPMSTVQILDAVTVRATVTSMRIRDYEERKRTSLGIFRDSVELKNYPKVYSALLTMPGARILGSKLSTLSFNEGTKAACYAKYDQIEFRLDGHPTSVEAVETLDPQRIAAIEVYNRRMKLPSTLMSSKNLVCAIVIWTKFGMGK